MRENGGYYKQFVDAQFGGEPRRYSKRKNPGSLSRPATTPAPSASDIDRAFEKHLKKMAKGGTWGDHLEISAFSKAYKIDVKIYQRDYEYVVSSDEGTGKQMVYVAYHVGLLDSLWLKDSELTLCRPGSITRPFAILKVRIPDPPMFRFVHCRKRRK